VFHQPANAKRTKIGPQWRRRGRREEIGRL
jgi:hypothetical protein